MEQEIVKAILDEIVESVTLMDYLEKSASERIEKSSIITKTYVKSSATCGKEKDFNDGNQGGNEDITMQSETENNLGSSDTEFEVSEERKKLKDLEPRPSDSNLRSLESTRYKFETFANDPEAIEPYSPEYSNEKRNINKPENNNKRFQHSEIKRRGVTAESRFMATNIEPSVIVINNNPDESATSSNSDFHDSERNLQRSQSDDKVHKLNLSTRRISKQSMRRSLRRSLRIKSSYRQNDIEAPSSSTNIVPSVIVVKDNLKAYHPENKIQITQLSESPGNNRRRWRYLQEDIEGPSTSSNIEPAVIVINDYSNESSISPYSTGEMQRRTERNFAFLPDSDCSDVEANENLGYQNRAYEPSEEIELRNETQLNNSSSASVLDSESRSINLYHSYIWSTTGLLKLAQVICCITMYISISLCRFSSRYIQVHCIIGACISSFLLFIYSYRIDVMYWKSYKIRLLLSEFVYIVIYTACDASFAIIKFEYDQNAKDRERIATMILMISTAIAGLTYCYDSMECFSFIEQAGKDNPEEKRFLLSFLPTCSQSARSEICDIFHTCIL